MANRRKDWELIKEGRYEFNGEDLILSQQPLSKNGVDIVVG